MCLLLPLQVFRRRCPVSPIRISQASVQAPYPRTCRVLAPVLLPQLHSALCLAMYHQLCRRRSVAQFQAFHRRLLQVNCPLTCLLRPRVSAPPLLHQLVQVHSRAMSLHSRHRTFPAFQRFPHHHRRSLHPNLSPSPLLYHRSHHLRHLNHPRRDVIGIFLTHRGLRLGLIGASMSIVMDHTLLGTFLFTIAISSNVRTDLPGWLQDGARFSGMRLKSIAFRHLNFLTAMSSRKACMKQRLYLPELIATKVLQGQLLPAKRRMFSPTLSNNLDSSQTQPVKILQTISGL